MRKIFFAVPAFLITIISGSSFNSAQADNWVLYDEYIRYFHLDSNSTYRIYTARTHLHCNGNETWLNGTKNQKDDYYEESINYQCP